MSKYRSARRKMPEWKKNVDRDMFRYVKDGWALEHAQEEIKRLRLTGLRTTPVYELREGSPGGPQDAEIETWAERLEAAEQMIAACTSYRKHMETMIQALFGADQDKLTFVKRYWWSSERNRTIYVRTALVLDALPFLAEKGGKRPNRTFWRWREEIYMTLADYMGYRKG